MTELQPDDFRGLSLTLIQAQQAGRVYRGLREAITTGDIPPGTLLNPNDLRTGFKAETAVITAALRGLTRTRLTDGSRVLSAARPETRGSRETQAQYIERIVRHRISTGFYPVGELLPPYRELARSFAVSAPLIQRALGPLFTDGMLTPSQTPPGVRVTAVRRTDS